MTRFPAVVSFGCGLIHGLGFAGALLEIGLLLALFAFNLGVELGQLLFIVAVRITGLCAKRFVPIALTKGRWDARFASYAIGCTAAFWGIERLYAF